MRPLQCFFFFGRITFSYIPGSCCKEPSPSPQIYYVVQQPPNNGTGLNKKNLYQIGVMRAVVRAFQLFHKWKGRMSMSKIILFSSLSHVSDMLHRNVRALHDSTGVLTYQTVSSSAQKVYDKMRRLTVIHCKEHKSSQN